MSTGKHPSNMTLLYRYGLSSPLALSNIVFLRNPTKSVLNYSIFAVTNIVLLLCLALHFLHLHEIDLNINTKLLFSRNLGYIIIKQLLYWRFYNIVPSSYCV